MGSGSLTTKLEFFKEELNTGVGWGRCQINIKKFKIFEEELNAGVGLGRGQIKVGVGVRLRLGSGSLSNNFDFFKEELNTGAGWGAGSD